MCEWWGDGGWGQQVGAQPAEIIQHKRRVTRLVMGGCSSNGDEWERGIIMQ